ncbi:MAG: SprT family zinc-dependent metalloprotease [Actinomycetota bacterium]|jgi:hypothetical protein|nr:SprT family zinc-dependent metalloprotease [Actinomycetota bacterium]
MRRSLIGWNSHKAAKSSKASPKATSASREITVRGIRIELLRKEIKNIHLRVYPPDGRVRVSAPTRLPLDSVVGLIEERLEWIQAQQLRVCSVAVPTRFVDGEIHLFGGRAYNLRVIETLATERVALVFPNILELHSRSGSTSEDRRRLLEGWYREQLRSKAAPFFEKWERILGVEAAEWRVRKMSTRWGSCNVKAKRIWLSLELAKKSDDCLEYVVVHELAHLLEPGHGPRFVAHMDRAISNWRDLKKKLNLSV